MEQSLFKKHSKSQNFDKIFYSGMIRLRNMNFDGFIRCQYTRTISKKKNMMQGLFKKNSKLLIFDEIFYSCITNQTQEHGFELLWFLSIWESY